MSNRREFFGHLAKGMGGVALIAAAGPSLLMEGCTLTTAQVLTDIENWVPLGLDAVTSILGLLGPAGASVAPIVALIKAAFAQLVADIKAYQAIQPPPVGALHKIEAGLQIIVTNFEALLTALNLPISPLATLIQGLAQVVLDTIAGFLATLPVSLGIKVTQSKTVKVGDAIITVVPTTSTITRRGFKRQWNKVADAGNHPEIKMHLSLFERF